MKRYYTYTVKKLVQKATHQQEIIQVMPNAQDTRLSIVKEIKQLLTDHVDTTISLTDISQKLLYSKTYLNDTFRDTTGVTSMHYYQDLRTKEPASSWKSKVFSANTPFSPGKYPCQDFPAGVSENSPLRISSAALAYVVTGTV